MIDRLERVQLKWILIISALVAFLFPIIFYNYDLHAGDVAKYLQNPLRVMSGQQPFADFWSIFPPGESYVAAGLYSLFGTNINTLLAFSWILGAGIVVLSILISYEWLGRKDLALITGALVFFSGIPAHYAGFDYAGGEGFFFFLLLALYLFLKYRHSDSYLTFGAIGCVLAIAAWLRLFESGAFIAALLVFGYFHRKEISRAGMKYVWMAAGFIILSFLLYMPFLDMLPTLIQDMIVYPPKHATAYTLSYFETTQVYAMQAFSALSHGSIVSALILSFRTIYDLCYQLFAPVFAILSLFWILKTNHSEHNHAPVLFFLLWAVFAFPKTWAVPDVRYLSFIVTPLLFTLPFFYSLVPRSERALRITFIILIALLVVAVPLSRAANALEDIRAPTYYIHSSYGNIPYKDAAVVNNITAVMSNIENNTSPGDKIFVVPYYAPPFYLLTNRSNPTYYDSLFDFIVLPDNVKQTELCGELIERNVSLVVTGICASTDIPEQQCNDSGFTVLQKCIAQNFVYNATYAPYKIYLKQA